MMWKSLILGIGALVFFPGCSTLPTGPLPLPVLNMSAERVVENISGFNDGLETFQGVGQFRLHGKTGLLSARAAWIGDKNGKLRIDVLGPGGRSQASFAADGNWFYAITHNPLQFHKQHARNANLNRLISIPLKTDDLHTLLAGKIPVRPHHSVSVRRDRSGIGVVLALKRRWGGIVEKIFMDDTGSTVRKIEIFTIGGTLAYSVIFQGYRTVQGFHIPLKLMISDAEAVTFDLDIQKFNPDIKFADSAFVLEPPENWE